MTDNLEIWNRVSKTPPSETKPITGKAYDGTSPDPYYLIKKATEVFGPCGIGWGFNIIDERIENGTGEERMSLVRIRLWYVHNGQRGEVEHCGGTPFSGRRQSRDGAPGKPFADEDAVKKSVTDALTKALSLLGFAGDIFSGLYDDSKYVNNLRREESAQEVKARQEMTEHKPEPKALLPDAEVDPATGQIKPIKIDVDITKVNDEPTWVLFGQKLLAGTSTAAHETVINEWLGLNSHAMIALSKENEKVHRRLVGAVHKQRDKLRAEGNGIVLDEVDRAIEQQGSAAAAEVKQDVIVPNAKARAQQLAEHPEADVKTGELPPEPVRLLPDPDSEAALKGLRKNLSRVGTVEALRLWYERAQPAMKVMQPAHRALLEIDAANKEEEIADAQNQDAANSGPEDQGA